METIEQLIGKKVRDARKAANLSQSDLAKNAKTSLTTINRLEKGKQFPNASTRAEIARVLKKPESELFLGFAETSAAGSNGEIINRLESIELKLEQNGPSMAPDLKELFRLISALDADDRQLVKENVLDLLEATLEEDEFRTLLAAK